MSYAALVVLKKNVEPALALLAEIDLAGADRQRLLGDVVRNADLDPQVRAGAVRIYARVAVAAARRAAAPNRCRESSVRRRRPIL